MPPSLKGVGKHWTISDNQHIPRPQSSTIFAMAKDLLWAIPQRSDPSFHVVVPLESGAYELQSTDFKHHMTA